MRKEPNRNVYVGHRYVPLILEEWDKKYEYEGLSVVTHKGGSYTSKKRVPVGIDILNKEFWSLTGNYNAQVDYYRQETERVADDLLLKSDQTYVDTELDKKANQTYVDTELDKKSNQTYVDTELDKKANQTYVDTELGKKSDQTYVNTELDKKSNKTYVDTELDKKSNQTYVDTELDSKVNKNNTFINIKDFGAKGDGVTNDFDSLVDAIEYLKDFKGGTIQFPKTSNFYKLDPTGKYSGTKGIVIPTVIEYLRFTGDHSTIKLSDNLTFSSMFHAFNKKLTLKVDNIIFDGNATNNPHNTGKTGNPRENAHRLFEVYCKDITFEGNIFDDFHGVNIVVADRHPDLKDEEQSMCRYINNTITNFGYDSSQSIHDSSALYSHVDYGSNQDNHYVIATGNSFDAVQEIVNTNAYCAMELGGTNVICANNITTGFYIGVILAHQFVNDSVIVANNTFNKCVQGVTMWSYKNGGNILSTDTKGLKNIKVSNNQINVGMEYWKNKAVYSSHEFVNGFVTHDYTGITTAGNLYRDIENIYITDNVINYDISNAPASISYNAIQLSEFTLAEPNNNLTFKNVVIKDNKVFNSATKALNISGRNIQDVIIENNDFIGFCKNMPFGTRAVTINNKTPDDIFENLTIRNNKMIERGNNVTYGLHLDVNNGKNVLIENNKYDNNWVSGVIYIEKPINQLTINETVNKDFEGDIVKLKETSNLKGQYKTPKRKLDNKKRLTYYVDSPSQINVLCYENDLIETVNLTPGGYMGYLCIQSGVPGEWKGMGLIEV